MQQAPVLTGSAFIWKEGPTAGHGEELGLCRCAPPGWVPRQARAEVPTPEARLGEAPRTCWDAALFAPNWFSKQMGHFHKPARCLHLHPAGQVAEAHKNKITSPNPSCGRHQQGGEASGGTQVTMAPGLGETAQPVGRRAAAPGGVRWRPRWTVPQGPEKLLPPHPGWELTWTGCGRVLLVGPGLPGHHCRHPAGASAAMGDKCPG